MLFKREEIMQRVEETPAWTKIAVSVLFITYFFATSAIQYVYGCVVSTLVTIESDSASAILCTSAENDPDATLPPYSDVENDVKEPLVKEEVLEEVLLVKSKPITSSIRGTIAHLRSRGASGYRGVGVAMMYFLALHWMTGLVSMFAPYNLALSAIGIVMSQVALTRWAMVWTHIVISEPSSKWWFQRVVPAKVAKKVALPTLAVALAQLATPMVPALVFQVLDPMSIGDIPMDEQTPVQRVAAGLKGLAVVLSFLIYVTMVVIPMSVALVRVYAAQLPAEETPIVPFDRTFGGLVVSEADGGDGKLTLKDAWKSFDWNARVRLIKVWVKMIMMLVVFTIAFFAAIGVVGATML